MTDVNSEETLPVEVLEPEKLLVRSTISLPGFPLDAVGYVDPRVPYISGCLEKGYLTPVTEAVPPLAEADLELLQNPPTGRAEELEPEVESELELRTSPPSLAGDEISSLDADTS